AAAPPPLRRDVGGRGGQPHLPAGRRAHDREPGGRRHRPARRSAQVRERRPGAVEAGVHPRQPDDGHRVARVTARRTDLPDVAEGWTQRADQGGDGYTVYDHGGVRLELAFLARGDDGEVYTPITEGRAPWPIRRSPRVAPRGRLARSPTMSGRPRAFAPGSLP